jgi:uncharacterized protein YoxC
VVDPLFWLGLSILLVAVSLTAVLIAAVPALQELARAARSIEKLADTLRRELPPTLEAIRLTGLEISDLTDDINDGVKSASQVAKQVDESLSSAKNQAKNVQMNTRGVVAGVKAAWRTWKRPSGGRRSIDRLPPSQRKTLELGEHDTATPMASESPASNAYREHEVSGEDVASQTRNISHRNLSGDPRSLDRYDTLEPPGESID